MMEGSSLRMMVGRYSALGTLEEMSWGRRAGCSGPRRFGTKGSRSPREQPPTAGQPVVRPQGPNLPPWLRSPW